MVLYHSIGHSLSSMNGLKHLNLVNTRMLHWGIKNMILWRICVVQSIEKSHIVGMVHSILIIQWNTIGFTLPHLLTLKWFISMIIWEMFLALNRIWSRGKTMALLMGWIKLFLLIIHQVSPRTLAYFSTRPLWKHRELVIQMFPSYVFLNEKPPMSMFITII